ncbi:YbaB/EbfC family nucleoid-associated protein [Kutzneria sp. CA-103260]|uniref:YbaB/EbfC family nucleoid-associated protein n=1 Tax=Kutzneria sp. CA-103260 TaxID=2802641 RepID=UPI001BA9BF94|nr:YbaB/EbfC family nucleoid-associated protein [Kutzneria sp. CA-103260]QUQ65289.1 Nucleoid-associated protein YbaB [Kutzneria sp. CA-103260]
MTSYNEIYALAEEIDANISKARELAQTAMNRPYTVEIEPNLGTVTVTGAGELIAVDLDPRTLPTTMGRSLGAQVMAAIHHAESVARAAASQEMAPAPEAE